LKFLLFLDVEFAGILSGEDRMPDYQANTKVSRQLAGQKGYIEHPEPNL
jgi:hypothetical protein